MKKNGLNFFLKEKKSFVTFLNLFLEFIRFVGISVPSRNYSDNDNNVLGKELGVNNLI